MPNTLHLIPEEFRGGHTPAKDCHCNPFSDPETEDLIVHRKSTTAEIVQAHLIPHESSHVPFADCPCGIFTLEGDGPIILKAHLPFESSGNIITRARSHAFID